ncbi:NAD(P)-binding protein [Camillea tinctor]|nr:NAD(P)-binding protein [Camillea tinctor]
MGVFSSKPALHENNLPDQKGKVFLITGSSGGLGKLLAGYLYARNGSVYIAARSASKAQAAIREIQSQHPGSTGKLVYLPLDLGDLATLSQTASRFLAAESRLDVLFNNAGVMIPPQGSTTAQGYELQLGTNALGPFLLTRLLYPVLRRTAQASPRGEVRVVWVSSSAVGIAPTPAIDFENMHYQRDESAWTKYARSKAGNVLHAAEYARRSKAAGDGVVHVTLDPGVLMTDLQRTTPWWQFIFIYLIAKHPKFGAYTELFAGLQPDIKLEPESTWVGQPGILTPCPRPDLFDEALGRRYWEWTESQIEKYM